MVMRTTPLAPTAAELCAPCGHAFLPRADGADGYLDWQRTARRVDCLARVRRHELLEAVQLRLQVRRPACPRTAPSTTAGAQQGQ